MTRPAIPLNRLPMPQPRPARSANPFAMGGGQTQGPMSRFDGFLRNNSDALLMAGIGAMAGETGSEQARLAMQGFMQGRESSKERKNLNRTVQWLQSVNPDLAQAVEMGALSPGDAYKMEWERRQKVRTPQDPYSTIGKLQADLNAGRISQEQYQQAASGIGDGSDLDELGFPASGSISQRRRALEAQGIDRNTALGIASGRYNVSVNPANGERVIIDVATGELRPLQQPDYAGQVEAPQTAQGQPQSPEGGLYEQAGQATGLDSTLGNIMSNTVGQFWGAVGEAGTFPGIVQAGQEFELFKRDLIRSLSLNPRFPVAEQKRIENLLPRGALTSDGTLKSALRSLDAELARIERDLTSAMSNPNTPVAQRQADMQTLRGVQAARARLGVPETGSPRNDLKDKYGLE